MARILARLLVAAALFASIACDPIPDRQLRPEEKRHDLEAIILKFEEFYAPLDYKTQRFAPNFDWNKLKETYLARALATPDNNAFYDLVHQFVSEMKDAHTSARMTLSNMPGRVTISYLGFNGVRMGDHLLVTDLLPTISAGSAFPIHEGDLVTHVNGEPISEYTKREMTKYRDLGNDLANLTYHMNGVFNRLSTQNGVSRDSDIRLSVLSPRTGVTRDVTLPWIVRDLQEFRLTSKQILDAATNPAQTLQVIAARNEPPFPLTFMNFEGYPITLNPSRLPKHKSRHAKALKYLDTFRFDTGLVQWTTKYAARPKAAGDESPFPMPPQGMEKLRLERAVPEDALPIPEATVFPAYVRTGIPVTDAKGRPTGRSKTMGYLRIDTFSPEMVDETQVLEQLRVTLRRFQALGVRDIVIDLMNNGGGSVSLVYQMAQMLSNKKLLNHGIRFGTGRNWVTDMERGAIDGPSDAEREIQRRIHAELRADRDAGRRISQRIFPMERLLPFILEPNAELERPFKIVLLTNEMCASAADIFASTLKDNRLAVLMGKQTMGAGGNVTSHQWFQTTNANIKISTTESLIVGIDGKEIENNGAKPNVDVDTSLFVAEKYETVMDAAFTLLGREGTYQALMAQNPVHPAPPWACAGNLY